MRQVPAPCRSRFRPNPKPNSPRRDRPCLHAGTGAVSRLHRSRSLTLMLGTLAQFARQVRRPALAAATTAALVLPVLVPASAARGPDAIADVAERVIDAVVNISTSQKVEVQNTPMPQLPNDPQLDELFRDFFNRRGQGDQQGRDRP